MADSAATLTVTICDDAREDDGTWSGVDSWGRRVRVTPPTDGSGPRQLRRGQSVRGRLVGDQLVDTTW